MTTFYSRKLTNTLETRICTAEGQSLGTFPCQTLCDDGILIEGQVDSIFDSLKLLDSSLLILEISVPHHRSIRASARVSLHALSRQQQNSKAFLRFIRMNFDCKQRYTELLYSSTAAELSLA